MAAYKKSINSTINRHIMLEKIAKERGDEDAKTVLGKNFYIYIYRILTTILNIRLYFPSILLLLHMFLQQILLDNLIFLPYQKKFGLM